MTLNRKLLSDILVHNGSLTYDSLKR